MAKIFFAGIKHSGKTGMAKRVSAILGMDSADSDALLLPLIAPMSVREFYLLYGKEAFMEKELEAVRSYSGQSFILSLGGGASDNKALIAYIKGEGKLIYLRRPEDQMLPFVLKDGIPAFLDAEDIEGSFHRLYQRRDTLYREAADLIIELGPYGDKDQCAERIASALRENGYV